MTEIIAPITIETQDIDAPVTQVSQEIQADITVEEISISAPVTVEEQLIDAPVTEQEQIIDAPIYLGLRGEPGLPMTETVVAGHVMSGHRVVSIFDGVATYANRATDYNSRLALTNGAAIEGGGVVVTLLGPMVEPSWSFVPGPVFVGDDGLITQTAPAGNIIRAGSAISATEMIIDFHQPLLRS